MKERSVLLLATNKREYLDFAVNCARSIGLHNPGLKVFIATNIAAAAPHPGIEFLLVNDEIARLNIEAKLYLDHFLQTEETLFIDSDSICYGDLTPIFEACKGASVTVVGRSIALEDFWGSEGAVFARKEFGIDRSILFNGGLYYIKNNDITNRIFERARAISEKYDEYGFHRIKNKWKNEEDLMSIGMVANNQHPIADDGRFMTDLYTDGRPGSLNVLTGKRLLRNPGNPPVERRAWYPSSFSPILIHFGGNSIRSYPYISQRLLLKFHQKSGSAALSSILIYLLIDIPYKSYYWIKGFFRAKQIK